jgi:phosphatidylserine decarboxylase
MQPREEARKQHVKDMSAVLAQLLPKHNKLMEKDKNGNWVVIPDAKDAKAA